MPAAPLGEVLNLLHRAASLQQAAEPTDAELLGRYVARRDGAAFEALVRRHGPMVLGVCRRLLPNPQDAEDAFQTAFLVLIRKAASVKPRERLAGWLYGVARHAALKAREASFRRRAREKQVARMPEPATAAERLWLDLEPLLDQELGRLPERYRLPIVLCDLEGRTRKEAARQLGWPEGTVAGRLARARAMLARRLTRDSPPLTGGALAAMLSQNPASAPVPAPLVFSTIKAAAGVVTAEVARLTQGVLKAMLLTKLKGVTAIVLAVFVVCGGAVLVCEPSVFSEQPGKQKEIAAAPAVLAAPLEPGPRPDGEKPKEVEEMAWGEAVDGLQAGIAFRSGEKPAHRLGETAHLVVRLRNVGDKAVALEYRDGIFVENPPTVTDADGKPATLSPFPILDGIWRTLHRTLAAGEVMEFGSLDLALEPVGGKESGRTLYAAPGKYRIGYTGLPPDRLGDPKKVLSTGRLDLEIKEAAKPARAARGLEGDWLAASFEQDATKYADRKYLSDAEKAKPITASFKGDHYRFTNAFGPLGSGKGTVVVHPDTDPTSFELIPDSGVFEGKAFRGIFLRDGDALTLCFSWPPIDRPTEFQSPPNSTVVLAVFQAEKP